MDETFQQFYDRQVEELKNKLGDSVFNSKTDGEIHEIIKNSFSEEFPGEDLDSYGPGASYTEFLKKWQKQHPDSSTATAATETKTEKPKSEYRRCRDSLLKYGCRGQNVKDMQQKLLDCGYELPRKGADGYFGPETKAAIKAFQEANGLEPDGIAGKDTLPALGRCNPGSAGRDETSSGEPASAPPSDVTAAPEAAGITTRAQALQMASKLRSPSYGSAKYPALVSLLIQKGKSPQEAYNIAKSYEGKMVDGKSLDPYDITEEEWSDAWQKLEESKVQKNYFLNPIRTRHEEVEKLVFERLIKNAR